MDKLREAVQQHPGGYEAIGRSVGVSRQFIYQMCWGDRPVPARLAIPLEKALRRKVTRYELCPSVFKRRGEK